MNRQGQLGNVQVIIMTLVLVGVLIGAGFFILGTFADQADNEAGSASNETLTTVGDTGETVTTATTAGFNTFAVVTATNATSGQIIAAGNYTTNDTGTVFVASPEFNNTDWNLTYTYLFGLSAWEGIDDSITAMGTIPDLLPLIVLIAMVVIILALVFTIPGARQRGA